MKKQKLPPNWNANRLADLAAAYDKQSEAAAVAEDEAHLMKGKTALVEIPIELVPQVQELLVKHRARPKGK